MSAQSQYDAMEPPEPRWNRQWEDMQERFDNADDALDFLFQAIDAAHIAMDHDWDRHAVIDRLTLLMERLQDRIAEE